MEKWTLETSNWIRFSSSSSSWWAFIWLGCPLPGQTVRRAEPIFVSVLLFLLGISFSSHPGAILFPLWWCLCDWMTWYNSQLLCVSISSIIHLFGCLSYALHVICPKLSFWLLKLPQLPQAFSFLSFHFSWWKHHPSSCSGQNPSELFLSFSFSYSSPLIC